MKDWVEEVIMGLVRGSAGRKALKLLRASVTVRWRREKWYAVTFARVENERLKSELEREGTESSRMASEGEVTGDMTDGGVVTCNKVDEMVVSGEGEKPAGCQQSSGVEEKVRQNDTRESRAESSRKEPKKLSKWAPGVRKVWGTCKKESMNEIAKEVTKTVGNLSSNFMVGRHVDQQNGKNVWWFTVKAPEKKLLELDKK